MDGAYIKLKVSWLRRFLWWTNWTSVARQWPSRTSTWKEFRKCCSPIGCNNTKHFFVPNQEPAFAWQFGNDPVRVGTQDPSAHAWKLLSRLFSGPDWLPLGLRGWQSVWNVSKLGDRLHDEFQRGLPSWGFSHQFATSFSRAWKMKCSAIFVPEENTRDKEIYFSVLKKGHYRHSFRTLIVD